MYILKVTYLISWAFNKTLIDVSFSFPFTTKCCRIAYSRPKSLSSACVMHSTDYTVTVQICRLILHCAVVIVGACYHAQQCHHTDPVDTNTRYVRLDPICARGCLPPHTLWHCATTTLYFILYTAHTFPMLSCLATSIISKQGLL